MMFKDKHIHKLYAFALAAVFALTLAGCGGGGGGGSATAPVDPTPMPDPAIAQRAAISNAIGAANTAVGMVNDTSDDATVAAANAAIAAANAAIAAAANVPDAEKAANRGTVSAIEDRLSAAVMSRDTYMSMMADEARMAMAATAAKLYTGIAAQNGNPTTTAAGTALGDGERAAAYNDASVPSGVTPAPTADTSIMVGIGTATPVALSQDKEAMVAAHHGWEGMKFTGVTFKSCV